MKSRLTAFVALVCVLSLPRLLRAGETPSRGPSQPFFSEPTLIKRAIVSNAVLLKSHPELESDAAYQRHSLEVNDLIALFDAMQSPECLRVLVSLNSYYLGESFGEMMECVVLRKGKLVLPSLSDQLSSNASECARELAEVHPQLCLSARDYRERVKRLLRSVRSGERCSDEEMRNNFGF